MKQITLFFMMIAATALFGCTEQKSSEEKEALKKFYPQSFEKVPTIDEIRKQREERERAYREKQK